MNDADRAQRDHAQLVRDADRLTEITPQLNILEKLLKERGIQIEYDYPPSALEYVHAKVTMPHGYFADGVNIRFTWELVAIRGQLGRREALICRVEGRRVQTGRFEVSVKTGNFNFDRIIDKIVVAAEKDEHITDIETMTERNRPEAERLEKLVEALGMKTHNLTISPDSGADGSVRVRIDMSRRLPVKQAQVVIEKMAEAGIFDLMNAD